MVFAACGSKQAASGPICPSYAAVAGNRRASQNP